MTGTSVSPSWSILYTFTGILAAQSSITVAKALQTRVSLSLGMGFPACGTTA